MVKGGLYSPIRHLRILAYYLAHYLPQLYKYGTEFQPLLNSFQIREDPITNRFHHLILVSLLLKFRFF